MAEDDFGTIVALEFRVPPVQSFEDIVEELDIAFRPSGLTRRTLIWDSEDIAIIERDALRILMAWIPGPTAEDPTYLALGVGQSPHSEQIHVGYQTSRYVSDILCEHLASYIPFTERLRADAANPLVSDVADLFADMLRDTPKTQSQYADRSYPTRPAAQQEAPADIPEDILITPESCVEAEYQAVAAETVCSLPKRLTIYTLGATMLIYTPPIGATLLVYSTLRDFAQPQLPPATRAAA